MSQELPGSKVLIVDDDRSFRESVQRCLTDLGTQVTACESYDSAIQAIEVLNPDIIVTDIRMPGKSGVDLLRSVRERHPLKPVVMMTGFSDLLDSSAAAQAGATGFLTKPFREEDMITLLEDILRNRNLRADERTDTMKDRSHDEADYMKVSIEDFISGSQIQFPIFLVIPSAQGGKRFIKVAHRGEDLPLERVRSYRSRGVKHLYLRRDDYMRYVGLTVQVAQVAVAHEMVGSEKRARLVRHTMELVAQHAFAGDLSEEGYEHAVTIVETTTKLLSGIDAGYMLLTSIQEISDQLYAHCTAVSMICALMGRCLGWVSPRTLTKVSLAGLLHDIGKRQLPRALALKSRIEMSPDEIVAYETHPKRGMEILSDKDFVPSDVVQAVYQHHERGNGTGYPAHLSENKIFPLAKVIAVADEFCNIYLGSSDRERGDVKRSIQKLMDFYSEGLGVEALVALHRAFNAEVPPELAKRLAKKETS